MASSPAASRRFRPCRYGRSSRAPRWRLLEGITMRTLLLVFLVLMVPVAGNAQTLGRIQSTGAINVGYVPGQPPFTTSGDPRPAGYLIELCRYVSGVLGTRLGIRDIKVKFMPTTADS